MRLDYNEPKKSYGTPLPAQGRSRRESSSGSVVFAVVVTAIISLAAGFGSGWFLSQKHAKKGFKAAMEQQSLENASKPAPPPAPVAQQAAPQAPVTAPTAQSGTPSSQPGAPAAPGIPPAPDTPLSFYKTLPSGQKSNVLGSGINTAIDGNAPKQPLQAAIPSNLQKQPQTQTPSVGKAATPAGAEKPSVKQEAASGFTVQVASLSLKSEAETLKNKLVNKGYSAHIVESNQGDKGTWYRVRVGRKLDQEAARELAAKLGKGSLSIPDKE